MPEAGVVFQISKEIVGYFLFFLQSGHGNCTIWRNDKAIRLIVKGVDFQQIHQGILMKGDTDRPISKVTQPALVYRNRKQKDRFPCAERIVDYDIHILVHQGKETVP